jgi:hypothetical protein
MADLEYYVQCFQIGNTSTLLFLVSTFALPCASNILTWPHTLSQIAQSFVPGDLIDKYVVGTTILSQYAKRITKPITY